MNPTPSKEALIQEILAVWAGRSTATEAAQRLNISRKTYYQWETRAMDGLRQGVQQLPAGRPRTALDPEQKALERENRRLQEVVDNLQQRAHIRSLLDGVTDSAQKK